VYSCSDFKGFWPVGVSAIVVANDRREAKKLLTEALEKRELKFIDGAGKEPTFQEIDITKPSATIIRDGEY